MRDLVVIICIMMLAITCMLNTAVIRKLKTEIIDLYAEVDTLQKWHVTDEPPSLVDSVPPPVQSPSFP